MKDLSSCSQIRQNSLKDMRTAYSTSKILSHNLASFTVLSSPGNFKSSNFKRFFQIIKKEFICYNFEKEILNLIRDKHLLHSQHRASRYLAHIRRSKLRTNTEIDAF